jgi:hypothetical protein
VKRPSGILSTIHPALEEVMGEIIGEGLDDALAVSGVA